jgi:hypothetical protein
MHLRPGEREMRAGAVEVLEVGLRVRQRRRIGLPVVCVRDDALADACAFECGAGFQIQRLRELESARREFDDLAVFRFGNSRDETLDGGDGTGFLRIEIHSAITSGTFTP